LLGGLKGPFRDIVLLNAAAAQLVVGKAKTLREGVTLAADSIDSGRALAVLDALVPLSHGRV
jgi:anthranilate phosphoribosyltransferase